MSREAFGDWRRAGLRMSPASPPVIVAMRTRAPRSAYFALVAAPFDDSSSGCAWTASSRAHRMEAQTCLDGPLSVRL